MFRWALAFLALAVVSALLGYSGIAGAATDIAWILFIVGVVVALVLYISGRRPVR